MYDPADLNKIDQSDDEALQHYYDTRVPIPIPFPEKYPAENLPHFLTPKVSLRDKRLQVIVRMVNVELTPEKHSYDGDAWHVDGMMNEDIVCTVVHYYSCENITESQLQFREAICEPVHEQFDRRGVKTMYGLDNHDLLNQDMGYALAAQGRTVVYPNVMQHRNNFFGLFRFDRPGHRKALMMHLVNPMKRITSTASIPPQMRNWAAYYPQSPLHLILNHFGVPDDIVVCVYEFLGFPLSWEEAENIREELMQERSLFQTELTKETFGRHFALHGHA
jgi:hypothetical protein